MNNLLQPRQNTLPTQESNRPQPRPNLPPEPAQPVQSQADAIGRAPPTRATQGGVSRLPAKTKTQEGAGAAAAGGAAVRPSAPRAPSRDNKNKWDAQKSVRTQWAASRVAVGDNLDALDRELRARTGGAVTRRALVNALALLGGGMVGWVFGKGLAKAGGQEQVALERVLNEDSEILRELAAIQAEMKKRQASPDADGRDIMDILQEGGGEGGEGAAGAVQGGGARAQDPGEGNAATGEGRMETKEAGEGGDAAGSDGGLVDGGLTLGVLGVLAWQASFLREEYELVQRRFARAEATWGEVLQYRLDYYLSGGAGGGNGSLAKTALLLNGTFLSILFGALLLALTQGQGPSNALWNAWTYVADPGVQV